MKFERLIIYIIFSKPGQITIPLANDRRPGQVSPGISPVGGQPTRISNIKPGPTRRPQAPPVRIDTCIVGDNNTCKVRIILPVMRK